MGRHHPTPNEFHARFTEAAWRGILAEAKKNRRSLNAELNLLVEEAVTHRRVLELNQKRERETLRGK